MSIYLSYSGPVLWNDLQDEVKTTPSLLSSRSSRLQTSRTTHLPGYVQLIICDFLQAISQLARTVKIHYMESTLKGQQEVNWQQLASLQDL